MTLSKPLKTIIVEDHPLIRSDIENLLLEEIDFTCVGSCRNIADGIATIKEQKPDLLLLDISLPDGTAFDLLKQFQTITFRIVFITAHYDYAIQAIKHGALDYIVKPVDQLEFKKALTKVRKWYLAAGPKPENELDAIVIFTQQYMQIVKIADILYCRSDAGYTTFFLLDGTKIVASKYLKEFETVLLGHAFIKTHQSYIVNTNHIDKYLLNGTLVLKNKEEIPVSTRRREEISDFLKGITTTGV